MKKRFYFILLLIFIEISTFAQKDQNRSLKFNINYFPNEFYLVSNLDTNGIQTNSQNISQIGFNPSISFLTKRKNYWEFQLHIERKKFDNFVFSTLQNSDSLKYLGGNLKKSNILGVKIINHINLLKNKNSNFRFLISLSYMVGYESFKNYPYLNLTYNQKSNFFLTSIGITPRIGYNLTKRLYFEVVPPIFFINSNLKIGNTFTDNPLVPSVIKKQLILESNTQISILNFNYNTFRYTYFNDLFSLGFNF